MPTEQTDAMRLPTSANPRIFGPALRWWRETLQRRGQLPSRADLSPDQLTPAALPYAMLIDVHDGGNKLRWRLVGTAHVDRNKRDLKGEDFDAVYAPGSPVLAYIKNLHQELVRLRLPIWAANDIVHRQSKFGTELPLKVKRLMLPLANDGDEVDLCLTILTVEHNHDMKTSCSDAINNFDYVGEIEKFIISSSDVQNNASKEMEYFL